MSVPPQTHERYERVFADVEAPFAFVDLDAMWSNAEGMLERSQGKNVRVASKSVRCRALMEAILGRDERFRGLMTYTLPETLWLAEQGFEDLLLAYPTADVGALEELALRSAAGPQGAPIVMVDCVEHLEMIESVLGKGAPPLRVCIDVDAELVVRSAAESRSARSARRSTRSSRRWRWRGRSRSGRRSNSTR